MKVTEIRVDVKTGLPNYSSRTTGVTIVADEDESLDIVDVVREAHAAIKEARGGEVKQPLEVKTTETNQKGEVTKETITKVARTTKKTDGILD